MYPLVKRVFDLLFSSVGIIILSIPLIVTAWLIKKNSEGPVFYRGTRVGKDGKLFKIYKFRTMVANADKIGGPSTSEDDPRITPIGHFLRKYKMDEVPQLFNVLNGEMSFVGPRPEVSSEVEKYSPAERLLLTVPPGITDWASIRFNDEGEILKGAVDPHQAYLEKIRPAKIRLGLEYVRKRSLLVDLQIIVQTLVTVFETRLHRNL